MGAALRVPGAGADAAGYRLYSEDDVETLRRVVALRERGLSVPAAVDRVRGAGHGDRPALALRRARRRRQPVGSQILAKRTLFAISRAIEDETMSRAASPIVFGAFQRERNYRAVEHRYRGWRTSPTRSSRSRASSVSGHGEPVQVPLEADRRSATSGRSSSTPRATARACSRGRAGVGDRAVPDRERIFETMWTLDPRTVRRAAEVGAALARRADDALGERVEQLLSERPLAMEHPAPSLTSVTNRIVGYLDAR